MRPRKIFHPFDELRCRDGNAQVGVFAGGLIRTPTSGEIQIDRHFSGEGDGEIRNHRTFAGGQNDRNPWIGKFLSKKTAQGGGRAEQFCTAQFAVINPIDDRG